MRPRIQAIAATDLLELDCTAPEMLIEDLWQVEGCGYLAGEPKCLKTYTILEMAIAITMGGLVFGRFAVRRPGPVLVVLEETKLSEAKQRLQWLMRTCGIAAQSVQDLHFVIQQGVRLDRDEHWDEIRMLCERYHPVMTFFDPLARMREGPENQQESMSPILRELRRLQVDYHTAVAVSHHLTKPGTDGQQGLRSGHRIRGTGDQHSWLDCAMYFTRKRGERRVRVEVEHRESAGPEPFVIELEIHETSDGPAAELRHAQSGTDTTTTQEIRSRISLKLNASPHGLKIREVLKQVGGRKDSIQAALREMAGAGEVVIRNETRADGGGTRRSCKICYAPTYAPPLEVVRP